VEVFLDARHITDPQTRIAAKIELQAQGLATDRPTQPPAYIPRLMPELETLMRKAGIEPGRRYTERQVDALLQAAGLDVTDKVAIKTELLGRGLVVGR
jgi:hypothetical protein